MAETAASAGVTGAPQKVLRWGILGNGRIARTLIASIDKSSGNTAVAIAARDGAKAAEAAAELDLERGVTYDELLADPEIDVIYNALPNSAHAEWTIKAAEAGKHVLSEKPFATSVAEADAMIAAAKKNGVVVMEAFMYRFHPQWARVEELIHSGALGKIRYVTAEFSFAMEDYGNIRFSGPLKGGAMMDVGCYCVNFLRYIAGLDDPTAKVSTVSGIANYATQPGTGVDELFAGSIGFSSGLAAQFACSLRASGGVGAKIVGESGFIEMPNPWFGGNPAQLQVSQFGKSLKEGVEGADNYLLEVDHFAACVHGTATPKISLEDSRENTVVVEALYAAEKGGQTVKL